MSDPVMLVNIYVTYKPQKRSGSSAMTSSSTYLSKELLQSKKIICRFSIKHKMKLWIAKSYVKFNVTKTILSIKMSFWWMWKLFCVTIITIQWQCMQCNVINDSHHPLFSCHHHSLTWSHVIIKTCIVCIVYFTFQFSASQGAN